MEPEPYIQTENKLEFSFLNKNVTSQSPNVFQRSMGVFPQLNNNIQAFTPQPRIESNKSSIMY